MGQVTFLSPFLHELCKHSTLCFSGCQLLCSCHLLLLCTFKFPGGPIQTVVEMLSVHWFNGYWCGWNSGLNIGSGITFGSKYKWITCARLTWLLVTTPRGTLPKLALPLWHLPFDNNLVLLKCALVGYPSGLVLLMRKRQPLSVELGPGIVWTPLPCTPHACHDLCAVGALGLSSDLTSRRAASHLNLSSNERLNCWWFWWWCAGLYRRQQTPPAQL